MIALPGKPALAIPPIIGSTPGTAQPRPVSEARAAAQRAFFQAALGKVEAPQAARPAAPLQTARAAPQAPIFRAHAEPVPIPAKPDRIVRPGSLVDIKV